MAEKVKTKEYIHYLRAKLNQIEKLINESEHLEPEQEEVTAGLVAMQIDCIEITTRILKTRYEKGEEK